jgi:glycosyltransferase involved in cell wall biosynthesis
MQSAPPADSRPHSPPPRVVVLMSTYQGERFVVEQLQSILAQLPADGRILVRDDGSSDKTVEVIESLGDPRITVTRGQNLGFSQSFLTLLAQAPTDADMVMFSDQDDVWLPHKIARAWQGLLPLAGSPALYGSRQMLTDEALRPLHATETWPRGPSFASALTENIITGCTAAMNRPAVTLLQRAGIPRGVLLHDWWVYLVISAFGAVVFDDEPTLLYRQHGRNQIGHGRGWLGRQLGVLRFLARNDWVGILLSQLQALRVHYGHSLDPAAKQLVESHFGVANGHAVPRWRLILSTQRWRQGAFWDLMLRLLLLAHKLRIWPPAGRRVS